MNDVGYKNVETYVRTMISKGLGLQTAGNKSVIQRDKGAHAALLSAGANQNNQKEKEK